MHREMVGFVKHWNNPSLIFHIDNALRGKLVVYDNQQRQIGWTNSDCTKPQTQKGFPFFL
jgi:hypothetical protein